MLTASVLLQEHQDDEAAAAAAAEQLHMTQHTLVLKPVNPVPEQHLAPSEVVNCVPKLL
jgi:hypothetical protein